jgi:hypothetical protein
MLQSLRIAVAAAVVVAAPAAFAAYPQWVLDLDGRPPVPNPPLCQLDASCQSWFMVNRDTFDGEVFTLNIASPEPLYGSLELTPELSTYAPTQSELRFSFPHLSASYEVFDAQGALLLATSGPKLTYNFAAGGLPGSIVTRVNFEPGNYLSTSHNPLCAALDCMVPGQDRANLARFYLYTSAIPEPSATVLLAAGLLALMVRRCSSAG